MEVIEYVEKLDNTFTSITKDYKYIYDNIHNYINDGKVSYNQLMDFEVSLEDLSIQLNSLVFLFKQIQIDSVVQLFNEKANNKESKIDYIVEKTIFNFMPLLFMYFMIYDKESILYAKDFIENKYENKNENKNKNENETENETETQTKTKNSVFQYIIEPIDD